MIDIANGLVWFGFTVFLIIALSMDTWLLKGKHARPGDSIKAAGIWTLVWVASALIFNVLLWCYADYEAGRTVANAKALEFFTGYLIEKSLSVDNLFAFYIIFHQFRIPAKYQQRVFSIGIWSAIVLRLILILVGVWLIDQFHWLIYVMGAFLIFTGFKIAITKKEEKDLAETLVVRLFKKCFRYTSAIVDESFFTKKNGLWYATPLVLALIFIELTDVVFALDSIPAIFAITRDPFIVWSSNIFAILGLRAMYFLLAGLIYRFGLLKYGIALILMYVGSKMVMEPWFKIPTLWSLGFIISTLLFFILLSVWLTQKRKKVKYD